MKPTHTDSNPDGTLPDQALPEHTPTISKTVLQPSAPAAVPVDVPQSIGHYRVLSELGRGGMGVVYLAVDNRLGRKVALKVMLPEYSVIVEARARFLREARAVAAIDHDNIVTIYEADEWNGLPYIAMQLLSGEPLDVRLKKSAQLSLPETCQIGRDVALGLSAAHAVGVVHRDIKPANLWVEANTNRIKILDFGLAKPTEHTAQEPELTSTGVVMGTPSYMSPEQALGEATDHRSDLFSLGVVLYRLYTGRLPFQGKTTMAMLSSIITVDPPSAREIRPGASEPLTQLIQQLLAKTPADRPASAESVARRLQQIATTSGSTEDLSSPFDDIDVAQERTVTAGPGKIGRRGPRFSRWAIAALAGLVVMTAIVLSQIISIATPKGTLVIESNDPDVEVTVKKNGAVIVDKTRKREIELTVGDYQIELQEKDGLRLSTDRFSIARNGKETVRVYLEKSKPVVPTDAVRPAEFREAIGIAADELDKWKMSLPEGFRPQFVSVRVGSSPPKYDAIAFPLPGEWHLTTGTGDQRDAKTPRDVMDRCGRHHCSLSIVNGTHHWIDIWARRAGTHEWYWTHDESSTRQFETIFHKMLTRPRPRCLITFEEDWFNTEYMECGPAGAPWESHFRLTTDDLVREANAARTRGWRPELLGHYAFGTPPKFRAIFTKNDPEHEWELSTNLSEKEIKKELVDRRARGQFPRCVCSYEGPSTVYTVLWLQQPKVSQITAKQRQAMQSTLDLGAALNLDVYGTRIFLPEKSRLPKSPLVLRNVDFYQHDAITDDSLEVLRELPPTSLGLGLNGTKVTDRGIEALAAMPSFRSINILHLSNTPITDNCLKKVTSFGELKELALVNTRVTGSGFRELKSLPMLEFINLDDCRNLDNALLDGLGELKQLKLLYCYRSSVNDSGVAKLGNLINLQEISLMGPDITDASLTTILKLKSLKSLVLSGCEWTDASFAKLQELPDLFELRLDDGTKITAQGMASLRHVKSLRLLRTGNCGASLTDEVIEGLKDCHQLETIILHGSQVSKAGLEKLANQLKKCHIEKDDVVFRAGRE